MTPLRFEAYLGPQVDRMASALVDRMRVGGFEVEFDVRSPDSVRRDRLWSGLADVVWACGLLTLELMQAGTWDAEIVAAPVFAGQSAPVYHSVLVATPGWEGDGEDLASARIAVNQLDSWSGLRALELHIDPTGEHRVQPTLVTGSHQASIEAVEADEADVASIDHVIWSDWRDRHPSSALGVLGRTRDWPSPPISVARRRETDAIRRALLTAGTGDEVRRAGLVGLEPVTAEDYQDMRPFARTTFGHAPVE